MLSDGETQKSKVMKKWKEISNSGLIDAYCYVQETKEFHIIFKTTGIGYVYFDVPQVSADKVKFETAGKDIKEHIINAGFKYKKLD